jgi:hypothetical protein
MRQKVTVNIDSEVYKRSKELGVNVSQAATNYLKLLNTQIEATLNRSKGFLAPDSFTKEAGVRSPGFEPGSSTWQGTADDWNSYRLWLESKKYRGSHAITVYNYSMKFSECLFKRDLSRVRDLPDTLRPNVLKALSHLAKFTGCYEDWKGLIKSYGLSWGGRSADDIFIDRLSKVQDSEEVWTWIRTVKHARSDLSGLLDLMAVSGLRFGEAAHCCNLLVSLSREGKLDSYYVHDVLEHWRFKEIFLRNSKKAFVSFVPESVIKGICGTELLPSISEVSRWVEKCHLPLRWGDIREAHGTFMTKFLKPSEIDFLHGRVTSSVFMANYFNPSLISDLKERVFQGINEILEKVKT